MASNIDLSNGGVYHFSYQHDGSNEYLSTEDVVEKIARHLKGHSFIKKQRAELLVIGNDSENRIFVLNDPEPWALEKFRAENKLTQWQQRRIGNDRIKRVIVRNMLLEGKESEILVALNAGAPTKRGYSRLTPYILSCNTQELDALMTELMQLHLFKIGKSSLLAWLRSEYHK